MWLIACITTLTFFCLADGLFPVKSSSGICVLIFFSFVFLFFFFFRWPRTLAGIRAYLPCNRLSSTAGTYSGSLGDEQRAWRYCDRRGVWSEDDYSRCQFQKDITRFLYVINQVRQLSDLSLQADLGSRAET